MKKPLYGPSIYYASDKNVFDALNQHKVDNATVMDLFQRRNIVVSSKTPREDLAKYFSRLPHDYYDHKDISSRLGVAARRERITSMDISGINSNDDLKIAVDQIKRDLESSGDVVQIARDGDDLSIQVQYSTVDYKRSEFSQVQVRDGTIEFVKSEDGYIVRNTQNDYLNDVRDTLLGKIEVVVDASLTKTVVSLFDIPVPKLRSKFFHQLVTDLPGYNWDDVTNVYVYKARPEDDDSLSGDPDTHVERVFLRGSGITRSELLNELLDEEEYYITKIGWTTKEVLGAGHLYDIEAVFSDPKDCTGFSFILNGVFPYEEGKISSRRRSPTKNEINAISRVIESKSREIEASLREEYSKQDTGDA